MNARFPSHSVSVSETALLLLFAFQCKTATNNGSASALTYFVCFKERAALQWIAFGTKRRGKNGFRKDSERGGSAPSFQDLTLRLQKAHVVMADSGAHGSAVVESRSVIEAGVGDVFDTGEVLFRFRRFIVLLVLRLDQDFGSCKRETLPMRRISSWRKWP